MTTKLLTAEQVAAKLQVHVKTIYRNTQIPRVEIEGIGVRWVEADVDAWIRSQMTRKAKPQKRKTKVSNIMRHSSGESA